MRKLIDPNSSCGFCGGYDLGTRCESCGAGSDNYDVQGGEQGWIMKNAKVEFGEGVVEGLANIGIDAEKEVRRGIVKARIRELAEQAKGFVDLNQHVGGEKGCMVYTYDGLEKFAELIVRECASLAYDGPGGILDHFGLEEHFGVEE